MEKENLVRVEFYLTRREVGLLRILAKKKYRGVNDQLRAVLRDALSQANDDGIFWDLDSFEGSLQGCPAFRSGDYGAAGDPLDDGKDPRLVKNRSGSFVKDWI